MDEQHTTDNAGRPLWWKLLGIRRGKGRLVRIVPTKWGWALMVLVVGGAAMAGFAEHSMKHDFCRSCHLMEPYYQAWHESTHNDVECVQCHFMPGLENTIRGKWEASTQAVKYITGTYGSMPHAEVRDESCMREGCHAKRLLEGRVNWDIETPTGQTVTIKFDHTPHLTETRRGKQLRCVSCHSQIVQGQHLVVTLDTCFLCHFKGFEHGRSDETLGGCEACHDAPTQPIQLTTGVFEHQPFLSRGVDCMDCHSDSLKGDGKVDRQVCWNCHNRAQDVLRFGDSKFVHKNHVTDHKVECRNCHEQIEHSISANAITAGMMPAESSDVHVEGLMSAGSCAQCHESPHGGPVNLYRGVGGRGVPEMPSPMYLTQVDCIACHRVLEHDSATAEVAGQTFVAAQAACNHCHGDEQRDTLETWKDTLALVLLDAEPKVEAARQALHAANQLPGPEKLRLARLLDDAQHNLRFVKLGRGVHNITYATALLSVTIDNCDRILAELSPPPLAPDAVPRARFEPEREP